MTTPTEQRQILISTDGHCGAPLWDYKPYLERRYQEDFDAWAGEFKDVWGELDQERPANHRIGIASGNASLNWDSKERLEHLDNQGIAAEVLFPNTFPPFYPSGALTAAGPRTPEEYEYRFAGLRAHNRWLADFCSEAPERRAGFAQIFLDDIDDAVAEVRWAKDAGLRGVLLPSDHVLRLANLYYREYDPLWAECADLGLPVHRHAIFPTESADAGSSASVLVGLVEIPFYAMRGIGHMILGGVFERHPDLVFVTTEITNASEIPGYLAKLDGLVRLADASPVTEQSRDAIAALRRTPSEYFATNCYVAGPTFDLRQAYDLETPNLMWGADIPHSEGTSPYSLEAIRLQMADLPESDLQTMLATKGADIYHFDLGELQAVADGVGPTFGEITRPISAEELPKYPDETRCRLFSPEHAALFRSSIE